MKTFRNALGALALAFLAALAPLPAAGQALTDYAENKLIDALLRAQAIGTPATWYVALYTTACSDSAAGTEVSGNNYSRPSVAASLANFSGTQSAGSTTASSGTGGQSSNNATISFATPSGTWGTVTHWGLVDAASAGNVWVCAALTLSKTINSGDAVSFSAAALSVTLQ